MAEDLSSIEAAEIAAAQRQGAVGEEVSVRAGIEEGRQRAAVERAVVKVTEGIGREGLRRRERVVRLRADAEHQRTGGSSSSVVRNGRHLDNHAVVVGGEFRDRVRHLVGIRHLSGRAARA